MIKFGTGGWRAIIADGFTKENIRLLTAGLCKLMERERLSGTRICLGYDRRFLSKESMFWAAEVLAGYGFRPYVINRSAPTPLIMFAVKNRGLPYGMAITASHNPAIYNGIKIFTAGGRDADALKYLAGYVPDNGCALGIATDGDADRLGVIDENGRYLHANTLLLLLHYYLMEYKSWR